MRRAGNDELEEQAEELAATRLGESAASEVTVITKRSQSGSPTCPDERGCHLVCKGHEACRDLKGQFSKGWFSKITSVGYKACWEATFPSCPTGKRCELHCKGGNTCNNINSHYWKRGRERTSGWFSKISCRGSGSCEGATLPNCPTGKRCELQCGGGSCSNLQPSFTREGLKGWFSKITCGSNACRYAALPSCPTGKRCELQCKGYGTCERPKPFKITAPGTIIDILIAAGSSSRPLSASHFPKAEALPRTMVAARIVGVYRYKWHPAACKGVHFTYPSVYASMYCSGLLICFVYLLA